MTQRLKAIGLGAGAALALAGGALADSAFSAAEQRAIAASGLPRASVVSVKPDVVVAIRNRGTVSQGGGVVEGVILQGEVVSAQAAQMLGYRSLRSTVNIDCARRRDLVVDALKRIDGWRCNVPQGAFYLMPDVRSSIDGRTIKGSVDLSLYLLDTVGVSLVEGASFGAEGTLRISYATSDEKLTEAMARVARGIAQLKAG